MTEREIPPEVEAFDLMMKSHTLMTQAYHLHVNYLKGIIAGFEQHVKDNPTPMSMQKMFDEAQKERKNDKITEEE